MRGAHYRPLYAMILVMGTPEKGAPHLPDHGELLSAVGQGKAHLRGRCRGMSGRAVSNRSKP